MTDFGGDWSYVQQHMQEAAWMISSSWTQPHVLMKPRITYFTEIKKWCAFYGGTPEAKSWPVEAHTNLNFEGVMGWGDTPYEAMIDFDKRWNGTKDSVRECDET